MGRKSWLKSVKNVFRSSPSAKDSDKRVEWPSPEVSEEEVMAETVSVEHFPADTSVDGEADEEERKYVAAAAVRPAGRGRLSREEKAAVIVQSHYRGYLARRARRALRGLVRLQALVRGHTVRKQAQMTMRCMQSLMRVQARVRARRLNLIHNHAYEYLPCSHHKRLYAMDDPYCIKEEEIDEDDDDDYVNGGTYHVGGSKSPYFKGGQSTVMRSQWRDDNVVDQEKALAYAFSCQDGPQWGWNWLEHQMATKHQSPSHHHGTTLPENSHTTVPNMLDTMSEKTVEIDTNLTKFTRHRFARHEEGEEEEEEEEEERSIRMQQAIPSYMAVTQSAKAKARTHIKVDDQRRMQGGMRHSVYRPDSSCGGDGRTPLFIGRMGKKEHGRV